MKKKSKFNVFRLLAYLWVWRLSLRQMTCNCAAEEGCVMEGDCFIRQVSLLRKYVLNGVGKKLQLKLWPKSEEQTIRGRLSKTRISTIMTLDFFLNLYLDHRYNYYKGLVSKSWAPDTTWQSSRFFASILHASSSRHSSLDTYTSLSLFVVEGLAGALVLFRFISWLWLYSISFENLESN